MANIQGTFSHIPVTCYFCHKEQLYWESPGERKRERVNKRESTNTALFEQGMNHFA